MIEIIPEVTKAMRSWKVSEGIVQLLAPEDKIHYPVLIMKDGFSLNYKPFL